MNQKGVAPVLIIMLLAALVLGGYLVYQQQIKPNLVACTQEAKICPDGSAVSRVGPNCEFAACPTSPSPTPDETVYTEATQSASWKTYKNTKYNFTFKYPDAQGEVIEKDNPIENYPELLNSLALYGINGEVDLFIDVWNNLGITIKDNKSREMWCNSIIEKQPRTLLRSVLNCLDATPLDLHGIKAFSGKGAADNSLLQIIQIPHGEYVYDLIITTGKDFPPATFSISDQILSTFKFLP